LFHAIGQARTTFWQELGTTRIAQLKLITYTTNPQTDDEYIKMLAREVEVDLVWFFLLQKMPSGFKAGQNEFEASWNSEGAFRNLSTREADRIRAWAWNNPEAGIYRSMAVLRGDVEIPWGQHINVDVVDDGDEESPQLLFNWQ
jgi:hypothetical protein